MSFIHNLKVKYHNYKFNQKANKNQSKRESVDFDKVKTIGFLFDTSDSTNRDIIAKFAKELEQKGKKVSLLGFINSKQVIENLPFNSFCLKDLNFALLPEKTYEVTEFMQKGFDILINLSLNELEPLEYIAAMSNAKFRVGPYTERTVCYELMIDVSKSKSLNAFIHQAQFFLEKMNKKITV